MFAGAAFRIVVCGLLFSWDADRLDEWLTDTEFFVPNSDMTFHVPKAMERSAISRTFVCLLESAVLEIAQCGGQKILRGGFPVGEV